MKKKNIHIINGLNKQMKKIKKKLTNDEIILECYRRMFKEAEPSADFDELYERGITKIPQFFMDYYLSNDRTEEICLEVAKENKFNSLETKKLKTTCLLGCSPTSFKKND